MPKNENTRREGLKNAADMFREVNQPDLTFDKALSLARSSVFSEKMKVLKEMLAGARTPVRQL